MKQRALPALWAVLFCLGVLGGSHPARAKPRRGHAAYHKHTEKMVTAARHEPRGSVLRVTNPETGNAVTVTVTDRGPFNGNRILDLSTGAFRQLFGSLDRGVGPIVYTVLSRP
jgi:rare lipoprotein A